MFDDRYMFNDGQFYLNNRYKYQKHALDDLFALDKT